MGGGTALRILSAEISAGYLACLKDPTRPIVSEMLIYDSVAVMEETGNTFLAMMGEFLTAAPGIVEGTEEDEEGTGRSRKRGCVGGVE